MIFILQNTTQHEHDRYPIVEWYVVIIHKSKNLNNHENPRLKNFVEDYEGHWFEVVWNPTQIYGYFYEESGGTHEKCQPHQLVKSNKYPDLLNNHSIGNMYLYFNLLFPLFDLILNKIYIFTIGSNIIIDDSKKSNKSRKEIKERSHISFQTKLIYDNGILICIIHIM